MKKQTAVQKLDRIRAICGPQKKERLSPTMLGKIKRMRENIVTRVDLQMEVDEGIEIRAVARHSKAGATYGDTVPLRGIMRDFWTRKNGGNPKDAEALALEFEDLAKGLRHAWDLPPANG